MFKTLLDNLGTILGVFAILNFLKFFWKHFEDSTLHATLGKKNLLEKLPQNMFKTRLALLGTILGIYGNSKVFWFFENISKTRPSMEHWAKKIFGKFTPKHVQNTFGHFGEHFWVFLEFWKIFDFWKHFEHSTFHRTLGKKSFTKKVPQNMFKTFLDSLGTILYVFGILNSLYFFKNISKTRPSMEHWAKKIFRKKYLQNLFKILLDNLGTILGIFGFLKVFGFFENISKTRPSMEHWAKRNFRKKYPDTCSKHFWTIWERF